MATPKGTAKRGRINPKPMNRSSNTPPTLELFKGLQALSATTFPKVCRCCNRVYETLDEYLKSTQDLPDSSGLKASYDDSGQPAVDLFRNCICGSTLMDQFSERRDLSPQGINRREKFANALALLERHGMKAQTARKELIQFMRTGHSETLEAMGLRTKKHSRPTKSSPASS